MNDISSDESTDKEEINKNHQYIPMPTCNCFRTFDRVARKIVYTTWAEI